MTNPFRGLKPLSRLALAIAALLLTSAALAVQPGSKKQPPSKAPAITEASRKDLMSLKDVIDVCGLKGYFDWQRVFDKKADRPLSGEQAAKGLFNQSDPQTRGPTQQRRGDIAEYKLLMKHRTAVEQAVKGATKSRSGGGPELAFLSSDCVRFGSRDGKPAVLLHCATGQSLKGEKLKEKERAFRVVRSSILPVAESFDELCQAPGLGMCGVMMTYVVVRSKDDGKSEASIESCAFLWKPDDGRAWRDAKLTPEQFIERGQAYIRTSDKFESRLISPLRP